MTNTSGFKDEVSGDLFTTYYDNPQTINLISDWNSRHPDQSKTSYFRTHAGRFAYMVDLVNLIGKKGICLDVAGTSRTQMLLSEMTRFEEVLLLPPGIDVELDPWADRLGLCKYDFVIFAEVIEHLGADPALALHEISRCLKPGGIFLLTTVNIASVLGLYHMAHGYAPYAMSNIFGKHGDRHQREYAPIELQKLVAAQGFETWMTTTNLYQTAEIKHRAQEWFKKLNGLNNRFHGDTIVIVGEKKLEIDEPYRLHPIYHDSVSSNKRGDSPPYMPKLLHSDWKFDLSA